MAWVRVDTQTILTIDDVVITRSQRVSVRHMTDAADVQPHHRGHHGHHHLNNKNISGGADHHQVAAAGNNNALIPSLIPSSHQSAAMRPPATNHLMTVNSINNVHKTWQLIIRDIQSSDAGLYVIRRYTDWIAASFA